VEECRPFETELYRFLENSRPAILTGIREKKTIDDALKADLTSAINEVKGRMKQGRKPAMAGATA
jgi:F0F1-type ATP synthase alpha subunit